MKELKDKTIPFLLRNTIENIHHPDHPFLLYRGKKEYESITYAQVMEKVDALSAFFLDIGIKKRDRLALILDNCPEYVYFDQALQQIAAVNVSVYPTLLEKDIEYILNDSGSKCILVGNHFLLKKILKIADNCPALKYIIPIFDDYAKIVSSYQGQKNCMGLNQVIKKGLGVLDNKKEEIIALRESLKPDDLSSLIYTSGTTGTPKGTMLNHGNFVDNVRACLEQITAIGHDETFLSFLPLSHVFERTATYHVCLAMGCKIAFAESLEALGRNMLEVKPTVMNVVPRLLEKIKDKSYKTAMNAGGIKAMIFNQAIKTGAKVHDYRQKGKTIPTFLALKQNWAEKLVFSKIKEKTGGKLKFMISGGAALPKSVGDFFGSLGIIVLEGYGLTETSPVVAVNLFEKQVSTTVGPVIPGIEIGIQNPDTREILTVQTHDGFDGTFESEEGEIIVRGHCIMQGYWNKPAETQAAIDSEKWFHTGDIGRFYKGNLQITDRLKNMIVNAYGKNVYPTPVENVYLNSHKIEQLFLIGDKQEYISAILVPNKELMTDTFELSEDFFSAAAPFIDDQRIYDWLESDIKKLSAELAKFERIKEFAIKRNPFTIDDGEMTPTLKIKRKVVEQKYADKIEELYKNRSHCP